MMSDGVFSYENLEKLESLIKSNPYETLFIASKKYKDNIGNISRGDGERMFDIVFDECLRNISEPDEKVLIEMMSLEKEMAEAHDPCVGYMHIIRSIIKKNPSLIDKALDVSKDVRYPHIDEQLLITAEYNPDRKPEIFAFLRNNICDGAKNYKNMIRFANLSENEEIKNDMIKKLKNCEAEISDWESLVQLASLTGDSKYCKKACVGMIEHVKNGLEREEYRSMRPYGYVDRNINGIANKDVRRLLSEELFHSAEIDIFRVRKDGDNYAYFHDIANTAIKNSDDIIPDVMSALRREVRDIPKKFDDYYSGIDFHMGTFYYVLQNVVKKRPDMAKEAYGLCKDFNKVMMGDERHTYISGGRNYYNLLEHLIEADNSLKPEINSTVRENMRRDKEELVKIGGENFYAEEVSSSIEAGKKLMQKLTTPPQASINSQIKLK